MASIDPKLIAALAQNQRGEPLNVFLKLKRPKNIEPSSRRSDILSLVKRTADGDALPKFQYRELDDVLQVVAHRDFVSRLVQQPEVASAAMAPSFRSAMISPIDTQNVDESEIDRPIWPPRRAHR
jgi:hypothetical protein